MQIKINNMAVSNWQAIGEVRQELCKWTGKRGDKLRAHSKSLTPQNLSVISDDVMDGLKIEKDDTIEVGEFQIHNTQNQIDVLEFKSGIFPQHVPVPKTKREEI